MKNKTNTIETILKEFDKNWIEIRAGNPAFDWRILHDDIRAFLSSALRQVEMQARGKIIEHYKMEAKLKEYGYDSCPICGMKLKENTSVADKSDEIEKDFTTSEEKK